MPTTRKPANAQRPTIYETVTARLLDELRQGAAPWVRPWSVDGGDAFPRNGFSGYEYKGSNIFVLWLEAFFNGYESNEWFTWGQIHKLGAYVRKGQAGTFIFKYGRVDEREAKSESEPQPDAKSPRRFVKVYKVWNREQIDGLPAQERRPALSEAERLTRVESFVKATGSTIMQHPSRAFYTPDLDVIALPPFARFRSAAHYYATGFHEHGHWTGHVDRLDRLPKRAVRGTPEHAHEELVAELVSAFLCATFGIDGDLRHPGYLAGYIAVLENDDAAFFRAAAEARRAADYLLTLTGFGQDEAGDEAPEAEDDEPFPMAA